MVIQGGGEGGVGHAAAIMRLLESETPNERASQWIKDTFVNT